MISHAPEKRLVLSVLAVLAPLPLPFNDVVSWPLYVADAVAVGWIIHRTERGYDQWIPTWAANVLAIAYLPLFWVDLTALTDSRLVSPLLHLAMFAVVVKLAALHTERDKWHAFVGIVFIFFAAMGTSVHPTIVLYLLAFLGIALTLLFRFTVLHAAAESGAGWLARVRFPVRKLIAFALLFIVAVSVPLFAVLPRLRSPYIVGRSFGSGAVLGTAGFSDEMALDDIGEIRGNRSVAFRIAYGDRPPNPNDMRFKAATYDLYRGVRWEKNRILSQQLFGQNRQLASAGAVGPRWVRAFRLADQPPRQMATVWLQPLGSTSLPLPAETVEIEVVARTLGIDAGGALSLLRTPRGTVTYRTGLGADFTTAALSPREVEETALDLDGITPEISGLASERMGDGDPRERAERLVRFLHRDFEYTLDLVGSVGQDPVSEFLFVNRRGHCELFASSMVLMLRSQGIPARLVTGFLGAEFNRLEGYYVVRQQNAHAWVEAYLPDEGWAVFDPTPPLGRPAAGRPGMLQLLSQAYDYVLFRWDRYVLTYDVYDQLRVFFNSFGVWKRMWDRIRSLGADGATPTLSELSGGENVDGEESRGWALDGGLGVGLLLAAAALALLAYWRRERQSVPAGARAYLRLRRTVESAGLDVPNSLAPRSLVASVAELSPDASRAASSVVEGYLRESYGGEPLSSAERAELESSLRELRGELRRAS